MSQDARSEYRTRLAQRWVTHEQLARLDVRLAYARLAVFGAAAAVAVLAFRGWLTWWWFAVPVVVFAFLMVRHDRVLREKDHAARAILFYERGLARVEDRWHGTGEPGDRFRDDKHLYAADLDLFGPGSLFELLSIARTKPGEATLASWLKAPASIDEIAARQAAVHELTAALDLREQLSQAGTEVRAGVDGDALAAWAERPRRLSPPWMRSAALLLTSVTILAAVWAALARDLLPVIVMGVVQTIFSMPHLRTVTRVLHGADGPARDLDVLSHLLEVLERQSFEAERLQSLRRSIEGHKVAASTAIGKLHQLMEMHDWQHNVMFAPIALLLMWGTHLAWAIESWRETHGARIGLWLRAVGEFEALASLSAYRYEHPADPFPAIVSSGDGGRRSADALFDGKGLGHPLLPAARMVRNDVSLSTSQRLLIVSGSNMSGKSTLLRTVGINAVLAQAGAPVRAESLRLSPLNVGATLRIQDSLQEGRSRFYAEITRVRELSDLATRDVPLLFLLDELFQGTNSHDRLVGATGVLRSFTARGAIGLVTTHDLALTSIATELAPYALNVHFEDWFENGEMRFDYTMKTGPVSRSNAIALMRAVGLDVD